MPPANQSDEVGNGDARKPHGLEGPVVTYPCSSLSGVRPWRASVRPCSSTARSGVFFQVLGGYVRASAGQVARGCPRAAAGTNRGRLHTGAVWSWPPRGLRHCRGHGSGNSASSGVPGERRTSGCAACLSHARGMVHAAGPRSVCSAQNRAALTPDPNAAAGGGQGSRFQPLCISRVAEQRRGTRTESPHCPRKRFGSKASWRRSIR